MSNKQMLQEMHDNIIKLNVQMEPIKETFKPDGKFDKLVNKVKDNEGRSKVNKKMIWSIIGVFIMVYGALLINALI